MFLFWFLLRSGLLSSCAIFKIVSRRETELMVREKLEAFARTGSDMLADVSEAIILDNFRAAIRANEIRLRCFAVGGLIDSSMPVA